MVTLQQLRYFKELAEAGHLTRTAEKLLITQTTLSNTIKNLERQLGVKLFDRVGRSIQLSEAGKLYLPYVQEALHALDNGRSALGDYRGAEERTVSVAFSSSMAWAELIRGFHTQYEEYTIRQIDRGKDAFRRLLLDQEVDFVITGVGDISFDGFSYREIRETPIYLCVSPDHPLAERESVSLSEIRDEPFINLPESSAFRGFCDELFARAGIHYHVALECDYTLRGRLVEAGFGVALTTGISRSVNLLGTNVAYVPISDNAARRTIAIVWNEKHYLSRAARDFLHYAQSAI